MRVVHKACGGVSRGPSAPRVGGPSQPRPGPVRGPSSEEPWPRTDQDTDAATAWDPPRRGHPLLAVPSKVGLPTGVPSRSWQLVAPSPRSPGRPALQPHPRGILTRGRVAQGSTDPRLPDVRSPSASQGSSQTKADFSGFSCMIFEKGHKADTVNSSIGEGPASLISTRVIFFLQGLHP